VGKVAALRPVVAEGWIWLAAIAAANAVLGVAVYTRWLRPVITTGTPEGALAPSLAEARAAEAPVAEAGVEVAGPQEAVVVTRPRRPARVHRPIDRIALMVALVVASVVLVAVSVQPDLLLGLLG
jgi:NADH-quinone oxidoreductase subunit N